jgi:Cellulose binding domain
MTDVAEEARPPRHVRPSRLPQLWRIVVSAVLVAGLVAGVCAAAIPHKAATRASARVAFCGLVACRVLRSAAAATAIPSDSPGIGRPPSTRPHSPAPSASVVSPVPAKTPPPTPTPTPVPTPTPAAMADSPGVTISYSLPDIWYDGFEGKLTIINQTASALQGWELTITLPYDRVDSVWNANAYTGRGGSLFMTAASYDEVIEPGASQSVYFTAQGPTVTPASCTFDDRTCGQ